MKFLAIETSCDDTSISIHDDEHVLSLKTISQTEHNQYGGVVPEIASRKHSNNIFQAIEKSLLESSLKFKDLESIVYTKGPGLINSLHVGLIVAKTLSQYLEIPLYGVDHIIGHVFSPFIGWKKELIPKKSIVLIVSGGHTIIAKSNNLKIEILGQTLDDAIGEVYDKVAKSFNLGYPGGPKIDEMYFQNFIEGYKKIIKAPETSLEGYNFSFSGLKSWVLKNKSEHKKEDIIISFQDSAIQQLISKLEKAIHEFPSYKNLIICGGVSANENLRKKIKEFSNKHEINYFLPKKIYTGDNAAMIGYLFYLKEGKIQKENLKSDSYSIFKG